MSRSLITTGLFWVLAFTAAPASVPEACQSASGDARTVLQFIDGQLHRWREYGEQGPCIYQERPARGWLSQDQARSLLQRSRAWQRHQPGPGVSLSPPAERTLPAESAAPAAVIGDSDDRVRVDPADILEHPLRTVGFHRHEYPEQSSYRCTGTLISPNVVLTNAHCIHRNQFQGRIVASEFAPAQYQLVAEGEIFRPFGSNPAYDFVVNSEWLADESSPHDYGALLLSRPFEGIDSFMPLVFDDPGTPVIHIAGYPAVVHEDTPEYEAWSKTQWYSTSANAAVGTGPNDRLILHDADTSGGNSGSAFWREDEGQARIIGVHCCGSAIGQINWGPRLRSDNLDIIESWLNWQAPPTPDPADDFGQQGLPPGSGTLMADNHGATRQLREPDHCGQPSGRSLWWHWRAPVARPVHFELVGEDFDPLLAIYQGESLDALDTLGCSSTSPASLSLLGNPGADWHLAVDGPGRSEGPFELSWWIEAPGNDQPASAWPLSASAGAQTADTWGAGLELKQQDLVCGIAIEQAVWWQTESLDTSALARFSASAEDLELVLAVLTADQDLGDAPLDCVGGLGEATLETPLAAGEAYWLMIGTGSESHLDLQWLIQPAPAVFQDRFESGSP